MKRAVIAITKEIEKPNIERLLRTEFNKQISQNKSTLILFRMIRKIRIHWNLIS